MTPTPKLRFIERVIHVPFEADRYMVQAKTVRILQQWWEADIANRYTAALAGDPGGEWRDVPLEQEQCK